MLCSKYFKVTLLTQLRPEEMKKHPQRVRGCCGAVHMGAGTKPSQCNTPVRALSFHGDRSCQLLGHLTASSQGSCLLGDPMSFRDFLSHLHGQENELSAYSPGHPSLLPDTSMLMSPAPSFPPRISAHAVPSLPGCSLLQSLHTLIYLVCKAQCLRTSALELYLSSNPGCVTLGSLFNLSGTQFLHL